MDEREYHRDQVEKLQVAAEAATNRLADARLRLSRISAGGRQGRYVPREEYEAAALAVKEAGQDHQRALRAAGKARRELTALEHEARMKADAAAQRGEGKSTWHAHFARLAKALLPPDTYKVIADAAAQAEAMEQDGKARELTGRVLPALGAVGGPKMRRSESQVRS